MAARNDPYKNFKFRVEIDNLTIAGFSECTGLSSEVGCIEYREGGDFFVRKLPGLHKVGDITLKRGVRNRPNCKTGIRILLMALLTEETGL